MTFFDESLQQELSHAVAANRATPIVAIGIADDGFVLKIEGVTAAVSEDVEVVLGMACRHLRSMFGPLDLDDDDITEAAAYAAWQDAMEDDQ